LWPQTEYLRALQLFAPTEYEAVQMAVFDSYLATQTAGLWHDVYDLDGQMQSVQVPASTLYHLWGGLMPVNEELASLCQTCQTQN
jgi:mannose/cellobiose epimerase-like protein (N-acyl-D-glucosamine 2-epimerase family)